MSHSSRQLQFGVVPYFLGRRLDPIEEGFSQERFIGEKNFVLPGLGQLASFPNLGIGSQGMPDSKVHPTDDITCGSGSKKKQKDHLLRGLARNESAFALRIRLADGLPSPSWHCEP